MARVKRAVNAQKKRRTTLERAAGYRGQRSRLYRKAKEQVTHSLVYAYRDRKVRKQDFRKLWIQRINAAAREQGLTYNRLIQGLKLAGIEVDRRVLADLAVNDAATFNTLVAAAKAACPRTSTRRRLRDPRSLTPDRPELPRREPGGGSAYPEPPRSSRPPGASSYPGAPPALERGSCRECGDVMVRSAAMARGRRPTIDSARISGHGSTTGRTGTR